MSPEELKTIRDKYQLSYDQMAELVGFKNGRIIRYYEAGEVGIPEYIALLIELSVKLGRFEKG